jgi:hypothetical protein
LLSVTLEGGRCRREEFPDEPVYGGASGDFLVGDLFCCPEGDVGLLVLAPLEECAGGIDEQARFALGDGDLAEVDAAGYVDCGSCVPEGDCDVDAVLPGIGRAEGGPAQVSVDAEPLSGIVGFGEEVVGGCAVVVLGGGDRAAQ